MKSQQGNVLFLILIAVALFAALSYAVSRSGRSTGNSSDSEKARLDAAQMIQYAGAVQQRLMRVKLTSGCTDAQLDFTNTITGWYGNSNAPSDGRCGVFDPSGGLVMWKSNPAMHDKTFSAQNYYGTMIFSVVKISNVGTDAAIPDGSELVLWLPYIKKSICEELNKKLGVASIAVQGINGIKPFDGSFTNTSSPDVLADSMTGKQAGCYSYGSGDYNFISVLQAR